MAAFAQAGRGEAILRLMHKAGLTQRKEGWSFSEELSIRTMIDWVFQFDAKASPVKLLSPHSSSSWLVLRRAEMGTGTKPRQEDVTAEAVSIIQ